MMCPKCGAHASGYTYEGKRYGSCSACGARFESGGDSHWATVGVMLLLAILAWAALVQIAECATGAA